MEEKMAKEELLQRVGDIDQLGYLRLDQSLQGPSKGVRRASFRTAEGLTFAVSLDRGMDIPYAYYRGRPLCWRSPVPERAPSYYEPGGDGWLRSFFGGALTTCGLTHFGPPAEEDGEGHGLHGRISNVPADEVAPHSRWRGDRYLLSVRGKMRQAKVFGENLSLTRTVRTELRSKRIEIHDEVENLSFRRTPQMILYHINVGYPLLDSNSRLNIEPDRFELEGVDERAEAELDRFNSFSSPQPGYEERVYQVDFGGDRGRGEDDQGLNQALVLTNPHLDEGLGLAVRFNSDQLPYAVEWKMMGQGEYALGLEPANCPHLPRAQLEERDELPYLEPGESRSYDLAIEVVEEKSVGNGP